MGNFVEHLAGEIELAASGVEEDQVVGEVGVGRDEGLEVEGVEAAAGGEVSVGDTIFEQIAKEKEGVG